MNHRYWLLALSLLAFTGPSSGAYLYTVTLDKTPVTDTTIFQFDTFSLFTGTLELQAPSIGLPSPPFSGAVVRSDLDTFRMNAQNGTFVITLGTPTSELPVKAYQFLGETLTALNALGSYNLMLANVYDFEAKSLAATTTGSINITQSVGDPAPEPTPEPKTTALFGCGLVALCAARMKHCRMFFCRLLARSSLNQT